MSNVRPDYQRARSPEELQQRKALIIEAAATLLEQNPLDQISLAAIAKETGIVKSAIYKYFESREAIYLEVLLNEWNAYISDISDRIDSVESERPDQLAALFAVSAASRPLFCMLISALSSVLEKNTSEATIVEFKRNTVMMVSGMGSLVRAKLPSISTQSLHQFFHGTFSIIAGLWPISNPCKQVEKVLEQPEFNWMHIEFEASLKQYLTILLAGIYQQNS